MTDLLRAGEFVSSDGTTVSRQVRKNAKNTILSE